MPKLVITLADLAPVKREPVVPKKIRLLEREFDELEKARLERQAAVAKLNREETEDFREITGQLPEAKLEDFVKPSQRNYKKRALGRTQSDLEKKLRNEVICLTAEAMLEVVDGLLNEKYTRGKSHNMIKDDVRKYVLPVFNQLLAKNKKASNQYRAEMSSFFNSKK